MLSTLSSKTMDWINDLIYNKKNRNFILDPMSCIIRLSILAFKKHGTKISISDNRISYHEPNILQGTLRWTQGDNREDLHNLYYPIQKSTQWYKIDNINIIYKYSITGLQNLKKSYSTNSTIGHSIQHYIQIIDDYLNNSPNNSNIVNDHTLSEHTKQIYQELQNLWTERELVIVTNLLEEINKNYNKNYFLETEQYIKSLDDILLMKEQKVNILLLKSYTILE